MQTETEQPPTLSPLQQNVLDLLAQGKSIIDAAQAAGVHRNTITNWRRTVPAFNRALDDAARDRALLFQEQAADLIPKSIEVLSTILHNESASPSIRLRAALAVLKMASVAAKSQPAAHQEPQSLATPEPESTIRPAIKEALEAQIRTITEQQAEIEQDLHNFAQPAAAQPIRRPAEPGRNSRCPCGSGLKYKRCCADSKPQIPMAA